MILLNMGFAGGGAAAPAPGPAAGAGPDRYGRPRRILMPDGRIATPATPAEYRKLVQQAINAVLQKTAIPVAHGRTAQKLRRKLATTPLPVPLETIEAMQPNPYQLDIAAAVRTVLVASRQADDDALFVILTALA